MSDPGPGDALTEISVHAAVLDATADLLDQLSEAAELLHALADHGAGEDRG